ncbi:MAG: hypothetical protein ACREQ5_17095, partial [Candidatus Dormibacteria bacterium]
ARFDVPAAVRLRPRAYMRARGVGLAPAEVSDPVVGQLRRIPAPVLGLLALALIIVRIIFLAR